MNLLMDIGNTQTVVGVYENKKKIESWRFSSKLFSTEDEIATLIRNFLKFISIEFKNINRIIVASVVPEYSFIIKRFGLKYFGEEPLFISSKLNLPISIIYKPQESVGADRIAGSVAAFQKYKTDLIVIDFGTATTFDVITKNGNYIGGVIALGIEGQINALHKNASKLPMVNLEFPERYIGNTTDKSIQAGVLLGGLEMAKGLIKGIKKEQVPDAKVVATGGLAPLLAEKIKEIDAIEPDLILEGLLEIMELN
jgi:type III pantothenate kinase